MTQTSTARRGKSGLRLRAMAWTLLFIVVSAMVLPTASYLIPVDESFAQVSDEGVNNRANFWRAVREGEAGYSAVTGPEAGVYINNGGQNWRQVRNGPITRYGGWLVLGSLALILVFFIIRGRIPVEAEKSGITVPRWNVLERTMHWYTAILFIVLAITGLSMLFGREILIPLLGAQGFSLWAQLSISVHNVAGPFFTLGLLCMLLFWIKNNIPGAVDFKWFLTGGGIIGNAHPSAGKANGGEKLWYWIVILVGLVAVCGSGLALIGWLAQWGVMEDTRAVMQNMHTIHSIAALIWIAIFFGHAYIGTLGTEGALEGMTTGRVSVEWAEQHHDLWYEQVKEQAERVEQSGASGSAAREPDVSTT